MSKLTRVEHHLDKTKDEGYTDLTLAEAHERNAQRLGVLKTKLTDFGFDSLVQSSTMLYFTTLLETVLGDRLDEGRLLYERKLGAQLDELESAERKARLGVA